MARARLTAWLAATSWAFGLGLLGRAAVALASGAWTDLRSGPHLLFWSLVVLPFALAVHSLGSEKFRGRAFAACGIGALGALGIGLESAVLWGMALACLVGASTWLAWRGFAGRPWARWGAGVFAFAWPAMAFAWFWAAITEGCDGDCEAQAARMLVELGPEIALGIAACALFLVDAAQRLLKRPSRRATLRLTH